MGDRPGRERLRVLRLLLADDSEVHVGIVDLIARGDCILGPRDRESCLVTVVDAEVAVEVGEQAVRASLRGQGVQPARLAQHADERRGATLRPPVAQRERHHARGPGVVARPRVNDSRQQ